MTALRLSTALVLAITGCFLDRGSPDRGDPHIPDPGQDPPPGDGGNGPPKIRRGPQTMSDVHVEPGGERVWLVHSSVANVDASPEVKTAHLAVYTPATGEIADVVDTTGTLGKKILFLGEGRVLYVTARGTREDVFVTVDTVARRPLAQHTVPGNREDFRVSPSGRGVLSIERGDGRLHLLDTASLVDRALPLELIDPDGVAWAPGEDLLYALRLVPGAIQLVRYDLRTADLGQPLPEPAVLAADAPEGDLVMAPDGRHVGIAGTAADGSSRVVLLDTATRATVTVAGESVTDFARDGRAIVWQANPDDTRDFRLVDPATGAASPSVATGWVLPIVRPLRDHDVLLVDAIDRFVHPEQLPFLYRLGDGARTTSPSLLFATSLFERPAHAELWLWHEWASTLLRFDLASGALTPVVTGDDSVDVRPASDEIVIGTFQPGLRRLSMATGRDIVAPLAVPNPNDTTAPYGLTGE